MPRARAKGKAKGRSKPRGGAKSKKPPDPPPLPKLRKVRGMSGEVMDRLSAELDKYEQDSAEYIEYLKAVIGVSVGSADPTAIGICMHANDRRLSTRKDRVSLLARRRELGI